MIVPKGGTLERVIHLTVQGPPPVVAMVPDTGHLVPTATASPGSPAAITCPPVHIDLALEREKDGTHRVIAKSPDGTLLSGIDIPVANATIPRTLAWSAGPTYDPIGNGWGASVTRDIGPLRIVASAVRTHVVVKESSRPVVVGQVGINIRF